MQLQQIIIREIAMPLTAPFVSAVGRETVRRVIIVEVKSGDLTGYGESSPLSAPYYTEETAETVWHVLTKFLIPVALKQPVKHPQHIAARFRQIRRHYMAKAGLEGAVWDLWSRAQGQPLFEALGGRRTSIPSGIALGITSDQDDLFRQVDQSLSDGYHRIKIKIQPGWDHQIIDGLRTRFGSFPLMADANSAYTLADADHLRRLDRFDLMMIEQPLAADDIIDHARLQQALQTPICLDESIETAEHARKAIQLGSCQIINIKPGRTGGLSEARSIYDQCCTANIPVWIGGMLESGIGRAHQLALASLPHVSIPGDISPSARYFREDIIEPEFTLDSDGCISLSPDPGIGVRVRTDRLDQYTVRHAVFP